MHSLQIRYRSKKREVEILARRGVNVRIKGFTDGTERKSEEAAGRALKLGKVEKEVGALVVEDMSDDLIPGIRELRQGGLRIAPDGAEVWGEIVKRRGDGCRIESCEEELLKVYGERRCKVAQGAINEEEA